MKNTLITLALLTAGVMTGYAQSFLEPNNSGSGLGVKITYDYCVPSTNINGLGSGSGVSVSALYDLPVSHNLFVEPGFGVFYNTMDIDYFDLYFDGNNIGPDGKLRNWGFRIPLMAGYRLDLVDNFSVSFVTGPALNVGLSSRAHYDSKVIDDIDLYDNGWRRVDVQWLFGLKMHYQDNVFAEILGGVGLTNMLNSNQYKNMHVRRNMVTIGVGYKF